MLVTSAINILNIKNLDRILVFSDYSEAFVQWCREMGSKINCEISSNPQHPFKLEMLHNMLRRRFGLFLNEMDSLEKIKNYLKKNNLDKNYIILEG
ncbi:hypothetical protein LCGC14_0749580 [marine sediment metagenome]|uniref:Uncharacterized protein n=1 Tax=marine sediment metagenome TaxID=412755 RepID=A0A0F9QP97_9ZZZZ